MDRPNRALYPSTLDFLHFRRLQPSGAGALQTLPFFEDTLPGVFHHLDFSLTFWKFSITHAHVGFGDQAQILGLGQ